MKNSKSAGKDSSKKGKPSEKAFRIDAKVFFLTYKELADSGEKLTKPMLLKYLMYQNPHDIAVKPEKYLICQQTYDSGGLHFHAILVYPKRKVIATPDHFDYLDVHPNIQTLRNMKAALDYMYKEDTSPLTNMDVIQQKRVASANNITALYLLLKAQMLKDPFNFNPLEYCETHGLDQRILKVDFRKVVKLLKQIQMIHCNKFLRSKTCFKYIDRALIQQRLSPSQLSTYDSWDGYQTIVNYLNQIPTYGYNRPNKTPNLLLTGVSNIGKTSLFLIQCKYSSQQTCVHDFASVYPMGLDSWFPKYQSFVYKLILWNEAKLTAYSYDIILKVLEGNTTDLPIKGGTVRKRDNPLVIMTSNLTLQALIETKFKRNEEFKAMARDNLSTRIQNVIIPKGLTLFLLQKLLVPNPTS